MAPCVPARSTQDRPDRLVRIETYRPMVGDLVCFGRTGAAGPRGLPTSQAFIERVRAIRSNDDAFPGHCDIIVRVNRSSVVSIGGNVRNAVAATVTPLVNGRLMRSNAWPWSAALRMDGPWDPCARIEACPLGPGAARACGGAAWPARRSLLAPHFSPGVVMRAAPLAAPPPATHGPPPRDKLGEELG